MELHLHLLFQKPFIYHTQCRYILKDKINCDICPEIISRPVDFAYYGVFTLCMIHK